MSDSNARARQAKRYQFNGLFGCQPSGVTRCNGVCAMRDAVWPPALRTGAVTTCDASTYRENDDGWARQCVNALACLRVFALNGALIAVALASQSASTTARQWRCRRFCLRTGRQPYVAAACPHPRSATDARSHSRWLTVR
jgi:hypothetical protein